MTVQQITSQAEFDALLQSNKLFFVDFYADWCGPCKAISPEFQKLANDNAQEGVVEFYKIDIDKLQDVAEKLSIQSIPTFHAYKGGERVNQLVGANRGALTTFIQTLSQA